MHILIFAVSMTTFGKYEYVSVIKSVQVLSFKNKSQVPTMLLFQVPSSFHIMFEDPV
jgi:hypothetical protein